MTAGCQTLKERILKVGSDSPALRPLVQEIENSLIAVIEAKQIPIDSGISIPKDVVVTIPQPEEITHAEGVRTIETVTETISPDQVKFDSPSTVSETETVSSEVERKAPVVISTPPTSSSRPVIKEKIFDEPEEIEPAKISEAPTEEPKIVTPVEYTPPTSPVEHKPIPKKVVVDAKPRTDDKEVSPKTEKILKLFISYARQADSDENWKARISAICDMDEAYIELGGLAMSQIYAYQTQSLKKKKEFERLITSWIENGLPR
jgi:hypothetical protein